MGYVCEVTAYGENDEVLVVEKAYGNTHRTCNAAAGAVRRQMEHDFEEDGWFDVNVVIGPNKRED